MTGGRYSFRLLLKRGVQRAQGSSQHFYYFKCERPRHPNAPQLEGLGEIRVESANRAAGYFTKRSACDPELNARTAGVYVRADPADLNILDSGDAGQRAELLAERLRDRKSIANT